MSFLQPWMLIGLTALAVPIIIHLLNRRRFQKIVWAAMRFIQVSVEKNRRRRQVEDMILLALRCLILALIAFALARPAWREASNTMFGSGKITGLILLDNSMSMGMSDGTTTRFEKARRAAEQAIDSFPPGSSAAVWLVSDAIREVIPEPTFDLNLARKAVRDAKLSDRATDLTPALDRAYESLRNRLGARREIYLITDGQLAGWRGLVDLRNQLERRRAEVQTHVVFVSEQDRQNLAVRDVQLTSGLAPVGQPLRFQIQVQNFGPTDVSSVRVRLSVDDEPASDEFTLPRLGPGESKGIALFAKLRTEGLHAIHAQIDDDRLPVDNRRSMVVRGLKQVRVLLVDGEPADAGRTSEIFFLRHALNPVATDLVGNYFIKLQSLEETDLSALAPDDFEVLILANVKKFPEQFSNTLVSYVRRGGGLLIFPGPQTDASFYNQELLQKNPLLPAEIGLARGDSEQTEKFYTFQTRDFSHPITQLWNDSAAGTLGSARIYRHHILIPATPKSNPSSQPNDESLSEAGFPQTVLSYSDGSPAIMERKFGLGRVILFSTTADTAWNDLPVRPAFVPLLHRSLGSILLRQDEGLNLETGAPFTRRVSSEFAGKDVTYTPPRQGESTRDSRRIDILQGVPMLSYDLTDQSGVYLAHVADPVLDVRFASQSRPEESNLESLSPEQQQSLHGVAEVYTWNPQVSFRHTIEHQRSGIEFWPAIISAVLVLAVAESVLSQWFSRSR